ncbi:MAG TPA: enolase C-terminal domain-like protein [Candidatus Angelobacter sp.]|nr:enolase C-terminal domain-like protein [Candidatus Angelobacter sp.]
MRITDVRWTPAYIPIEAPLRYAFGSHPGFSRIIVEVFTNEGLIGLGECYGGASREGQLAEMAPLLIGEDPFQLERIRWKLAAPSALKLFGHVLGFAALEFACLDLQGQALGKPICDLFGGRLRDEIPLSGYLFYRYHNDEGRGEISNAEQVVAFAQRLVDKYGFETIKYKNGVLPPDEEIETFIALRRAFPKVKLRLDPNAAWSVNTAVRVAQRLHDYDVEYLEDPVWGMRSMARVNAKIPWMLLASNMSVFAFEDLMPATLMEVLDIVLLDPHWYGGISRAREAALTCAALGIDAGMHSGAEFGISQAAMLHLAATIPNLTIAPDSHYHHLRDDIIEGGKLPYLQGGKMAVPKGPGLGVRLDRDRLAKYNELSRKKQMGSWIEDPHRPGAITVQPKW